MDWRRRMRQYVFQRLRRLHQHQRAGGRDRVRKHPRGSHLCPTDRREFRLCGQAKSDALELPQYTFELHDRRIWQFSSNQVAGLTITIKTNTWKLIRTGEGQWKLGPDSQGIINPFALEEAAYRLGQLWSRAWIIPARAKPVAVQFRGNRPQTLDPAQQRRQAANPVRGFWQSSRRPADRSR